MGVPGLSKALAPLRKTTDFGCTGHGKDEGGAPHWRAIIDGPSFVYWRFRVVCRDRLAEGAVSQLDAVPSYEDLVEDILDLLEAFQKWSIDVVAIYFDTSLPEIKRSTREARLQTGIADLARLRQGFPSGFPVKVTLGGESQRQRCSAAAPVADEVGASFGAGMPAPPFIVSAAVEVIRKLCSKNNLGEILVPGEADPWIAARARKETEASAAATADVSNVVVFSDDSDLAIHDLGGAILAQFSALETALCGRCDNGSVVLRGETFSQCEAKDLRGAPKSKNYRHDAQSAHRQWVKAAFLLSRRRSIGSRISSDFATLHRQVRAGEHDKIFSSNGRLNRALDEFEEEHAKSVNLDDRRVHEELPLPAWQARIDVRLSELVVQLRRPDRCKGLDAQIYPPLLFESSDRTATWAASRDIRVLAYDLIVVKTRAIPDTIREYIRSGEKLHHNKIRCTIKGLEHCMARVKNLETGLEVVYDLIHGHISALQGKRLDVALQDSTTRTIVWIVYAVVYSYASYLKAGKTPPKPGTVNKTFRHADRSEEIVDTLDWASIHFMATVHGVLYSLRMLVQALQIPDDAYEEPSTQAEGYETAQDTSTTAASTYETPNLSTEELRILTYFPETIAELIRSPHNTPPGISFHPKSLEEAARRLLDFVASNGDIVASNGDISESEDQKQHGHGDSSGMDVFMAVDDSSNDGDGDDGAGVPSAPGSRFAALLGRG